MNAELRFWKEGHRGWYARIKSYGKVCQATVFGPAKLKSLLKEIAAEFAEHNGITVVKEVG